MNTPVNGVLGSRRPSISNGASNDSTCTSSRRLSKPSPSFQKRGNNAPVIPNHSSPQSNSSLQATPAHPSSDSKHTTQAKSHPHKSPKPPSSSRTLSEAQGDRRAWQGGRWWWILDRVVCVNIGLLEKDREGEKRTSAGNDESVAFG